MSLQTVKTWPLPYLFLGFLWGYALMPQFCTNLAQVVSPGLQEESLFFVSQMACVVGWLGFWWFSARRFQRPCYAGLGLLPDSASKSSASKPYDGTPAAPWYLRLWVGCLLSVVGVVAILYLLGWISTLWEGPLPDPYSQVPEETLAVMSSLAVWTSPILEECVFRGFCQTILTEHVGKWWAIGLTTVLFTLFHNQYLDAPLALASVALIGVLFGVLRAVYGSVIPGVLGHLLNNALASLALDRMLEPLLDMLGLV